MPGSRTVELTLENASVTRNVLQGSAGISLQGGGLFTTSPVTLTNTQIALNLPDQCVGCQGMEAANPGGTRHTMIEDIETLETAADSAQGRRRDDQDAEPATGSAAAAARSRPC